MLVIPAIDIKDGKVVRLVQGRKDKKVYSHDPVKTALHWVRQGAELLHIIDLDVCVLPSYSPFILLSPQSTPWLYLRIQDILFAEPNQQLYPHLPECKRYYAG